MPFKREEVSLLLSQCHRRCCICHRFCGIKIETDHIVPTSEHPSDDIENAIPVCFECHAEIHSYNEKHPRGRKYSSDELRLHKAQWLKICAAQPDLLVGPIHDTNVGPLQALIDELCFNATVAAVVESNEHGCRFHNQQFMRAIHEGSISLLLDELRELILSAYRKIGSANVALESKSMQPMSSDPWAQASNEAAKRMFEAGKAIEAARSELLRFLSTETAMS